MPKITGLPELATPADDDLLAVVDDTDTTTKRFTFANLKAWLQSLTNFVTTSMITDNAVTSDKANLSYVHEDGSSYTTFTLSLAGTGEQESGWNIVLPTAGTWLVMAKVRTRLNTTAGGIYIRLWLYDNSRATYVAESICDYDALRGVHTIHNQFINAVVTTDGPNQQVRIRTAVSATANVTYARLESDGNGWSTMTAVRIA